MEAAGAQVDCLKTGEAAGVDYFAYDLICVGFPSYQWHVPESVDAFLKKKHAGYRDQGRIKLTSPTLPGKYALIFCTYSGPHTGINEADPRREIRRPVFRAPRVYHPGRVVYPRRISREEWTTAPKEGWATSGGCPARTTLEESSRPRPTC